MQYKDIDRPIANSIQFDGQIQTAIAISFKSRMNLNGLGRLFEIYRDSTGKAGKWQTAAKLFSFLRKLTYSLWLKFVRRHYSGDHSWLSPSNSVTFFNVC